MGFQPSGFVNKPLSAMRRAFLPSVSTTHRLKIAREEAFDSVPARNKMRLPSGVKTGPWLYL